MMKSLILAFGVLLSVSSAFAGVSVIIDGQNYSCSQGGSGGGNQCECIANYSGSSWRFSVYKAGARIDIYSYSHNSEADALRTCRAEIIKSSQCYN